MEIHRTRKQENGGQVGPGKALLQRRGVGGLGPLPPPPSHPGAPPPYTLHLQGNSVLSAGAFIFPGEGGGKGSPSGSPLPGAPLKMVQTLPGQSHLPLPTRTHPWLRSSWYPSITNLKLDLVTPSLGPVGSLFLHQSLFPISGAPQIRRTPMGIALFLLWNSSAHLSIHPSIHPSLPSVVHLAPLAGWAPQPSTWSTCMAACALPLPPHTHPYKGAQGVRGGASWGGRNLLPNLGPPTQYCIPPSVPRATVLHSISHPAPPISLCLAVIDQ